MQLPAFCDSCGAIFPGFEGGDATNVGLYSVSAECPLCGGVGHIPDGVYDFVGDTIHVLSAPQRTRDELSRLATILEGARSSDASPEAVSQEIREEIPELASLVDPLRSSQRRAEWTQYLGLLLMIILFLMSQRDSGKTTIVNTTEVFNYVYSQPARPLTMPAPSTVPAPPAKPAPMAKAKSKAQEAKPSVNRVPRTGDKRKRWKHRGRRRSG